MIESLQNEENTSSAKLREIIENGLLYNKDRLERTFAKIKDSLFSSSGIYIFGAHTVGKQAFIECQKRNIAILGFLDNSPSKNGTVFCDKPVFLPQSDKIIKDAGVLIASGNFSHEIYKQLMLLQFSSPISLSAFYFVAGAENQPEKDFREDFCSHLNEYQSLFQQLEDWNSKKTLLDIIQFRLTFDTKWLAKAKVTDHKQWYCRDFYNPSASSVFVDGGGFDGDTAEEFIKFSNLCYKKIYVFEPDLELAEKANLRLAEYPMVNIIPNGLSDQSQSFHFNNTGVTNGSFESQGDQIVKLDSIDNLVQEPITFLKLDVEGFEEQALLGAQKQIKENNPTIAIAVYHKAKDLWYLPKKIKEINKNYKFYLRHYTQTSFESVIYALPLR